MRFLVSFLSGKTKIANQGGMWYTEHSRGCRCEKYEYVQIHIGRMDGSKSGEIRQAINDYAAKGFRYVGFVPVRENDRRRITDMDLIFEKDAELSPDNAQPFPL